MSERSGRPELDGTRRARVEVDGVAAWARAADGMLVLDDGRRIPDAEASYLAPVEPSKILAVHLTYRSRVEEYGARIPPAPSYFMKPPSSLSGHRGVIRRPHGTRFLNYEGELAVVIGRRMKNVSPEQALAHVAAYAPANDVGLHDFRHADRGSMLRVKGQDGFLPLGPHLTPASEFDPTDFTLRTYLNGEVVQEATAEDLIWGVAYQLADVCRLITLEPGDVLLTGTPANSRPMEPGDRVAVEISGLGRVESSVVDWDVDLTRVGEQPAVSANTLHVALAIPEEEAERMAESKEHRVKVHVDMNLCQSHGECVLVAPDVFELGDDDVLVWEEDVPEARRADMEAAVNACPMMAISLED